MDPLLDISRYYGPAYYGDDGLRFNAEVERWVAGFRRARVRLLVRLCPRPGPVLDLGCGRGLMLAALKAMGWECVGTEASAGLARAARRRHGLRVVQTVDAPLPFPDAGMGMVTSWHTLEHMERPVRVLAEAHRVLRPGGLLVVEVPNFSSVQARLGGPRWFHLDAPRHRYHFTRGELRLVLTRLGYTIVTEGTLSLEYGPFGMAQSILNRLTFRPNVLYRTLKRSRRAPGRSPPSDRAIRNAWDIAATVALALPAAAAGTAMELLSVLAGRGGVVRIVARK